MTARAAAACALVLIAPASAGAQDMPAEYRLVLDALGRPGDFKDNVLKIIGHPGEQSGAVYKITIGRPDLDVREMGAAVNARMGLNTWAAFYGRDSDAVVAGDVAMTEEEVTPVLKALRGAGLDVVAIHHHMTNSRPVVIFLHYWGRGPAARLARGVRAALDAQR